MNEPENSPTLNVVHGDCCSPSGGRGLVYELTGQHHSDEQHYERAGEQPHFERGPRRLLHAQRWPWPSMNSPDSTTVMNSTMNEPENSPTLNVVHGDCCSPSGGRGLL
ncbi:hypothetical protein O0L34_g14572 [Tuta absoluta]|nr:hypothetical protein O0L34_g14571 [Tuta absoluta]KAJ2941527.1 hypothetical protein O0L34_g14572 [Tuta absoluta]